MAWFQDDVRDGLHRVKPASVHADVHFATFEPVNGEPIDKFSINGAYRARQHRYPCADRINPPA